MTTKEELREKLQKDLENNGNLEEINCYLEEMRKRRANTRAKATSERPQLSTMPPSGILDLPAESLQS